MANIVKLDYTADEINERLGEVYDLVPQWGEVALDMKTDGYYMTSGEFAETASGRAYAIVNVAQGDKFKLTSYTRSALIAAAIYFNGDTVISYEKLGTGTDEYLNEYDLTIPNGCNKIIVQSANSSITYPILYKYNVAKNLRYYKKEETAAKYGVRWSISNVDDLGERCFASVGLAAKIGVGNADGYSDFDKIYPWSDIKRCNVNTNANGATVVTYEGEDGFALDGTNGDVFVRIPKFTIRRYIENGYEYRVIGEQSAPVHEAFIENGKELDEIFISAFEGYVDVTDKLRSIAGIIPTSNIPPVTFLEKARNNGNNYSLYDMRSVDAIWSLMVVEYGCRNTNQIIGYGVADYCQPTASDTRGFIVESATNTNSVKTTKLTNTYLLYMPIGSTITICANKDQRQIIAQRKITNIEHTSDGLNTVFTFDGDGINVDTNCFVGSGALPTNFCENAPTGGLSWHTGRADWITKNNTRNPIRYRWIENVVGNLWHFLPDITFKDLQMYVCKNMSDYEFHKYTDTYLPYGKVLELQSNNGNKQDIVDVNFWVDTLLNDTFAKFVSIGKTYNKALLSTQAFGAYYYLNTGVRCIANGGGFDHLYRCNMLTHRAWISTAENEKWHLYGARLIFKKIK